MYELEIVKVRERGYTDFLQGQETCTMAAQAGHGPGWQSCLHLC